MRARLTGDWRKRFCQPAGRPLWPAQKTHENPSPDHHYRRPRRLSSSASPSIRFVAVDTEFMRENTYWPDLCLIQIASTEEAAAIDPQGRGIDLTPLLDLLVNNEDVLKVFHAGGQDLEIIYNLTGKTPHPLFDTQIAAMALGHGEQIGYSNLIEIAARPQPRQGRALHRLEPPPARQAPDRLCDRRRHPSRDDLPAHAREAEEDRPRRLARRGDGAARRPVELRLRARGCVEAPEAPEPQSGGARPPEGARRVARDRGAAQEHAARPDREGRHARRARQPSAEDAGRSRARCAGCRPAGGPTTSARG